MISRKVAAIFSAILAACMLAACAAPLSVPVEGAQQGQSASGLIINEVVSSNAYSLVDDYGVAPDWVEIYNGTKSTVDLANYGLTDNREKPYKFTFPAGTKIKSGEYLIVYAVGDESEERSGLRAHFALSSSGEYVILTSDKGAVLSEVSIPEMRQDISWGRTSEGKYAYFSQPTPGKENNTTPSDSPEVTIDIATSSILINEVMPNNQYSATDADGDRSDWVELVSVSSQSVNLAGYGLSDDLNEKLKWQMPDINLGVGEYVVVFLSGKDRKDGELHANFKLSNGEETMYLSTPQGAVLDTVVLSAKLPGNVSYGRNSSNIAEWLYYPTPTPGFINNTKGFTVINEAMKLDGVYINEVCAANPAKSGKADWVELYNNTSQGISLKGYGLTTSLSSDKRYTFPDVTIGAGEYLVVEAGRHAASDDELDADFGIAASGEILYLLNENGAVVDHFNTGALSADITSGRDSEADAETRYYYLKATPGAANSGEKCTTYTETPRFSVGGGYISGAADVEIQSAQGSEIYYTTDGTEPSKSSKRYEGAVNISTTTTLRAIAYADGKLPSSVNSTTYINEEKHDIPVVCISSAPDGLFSDESGIFANGPGYTEKFPHTGANFWKDWERKISFEFYEADGTLGVKFDAGLKVFGQYSRGEDQKSMAVYLRGAYGQSKVTYPFFRDYDVTTFSSLLLRTSGQDWVHTKIRDAFFAQAIKGVVDIDYMEYRPVALYINGKYWGLYNLREKVNESYIENHYDIDGYNIDMIKGNKNALTGDNDAFQELRTYMKGHDLSKQEYYDYVASKIDVQNFMEYAIIETYFNNTDTGNIKFWRPRTEGGKWRWILFDMDWGMFPSTYKWNMIEEFFSEKGHGVGNNFYSHVQMGLMQNAGFREAFYERYAYHIQNTFAPDRLCALVDKMAGEIRSEMTRHCARWGKPADAATWEKEISKLKQIIREKPALTIEDLQETFSIPNATMDKLFPNR